MSSSQFAPDVFSQRRISLAQIDAAALALRAAAAMDIRIAGDAHAGVDIDDGLADGLDDAGEFMAERHRRPAGKIAVEEVAVRAADAGRLDPDQKIVRAGLRLFHRAYEEFADRLQPRRFHAVLPFSSGR